MYRSERVSIFIIIYNKIIVCFKSRTIADNTILFYIIVVILNVPWKRGQAVMKSLKRKIINKGLPYTYNYYILYVHAYTHYIVDCLLQ